MSLYDDAVVALIAEGAAGKDDVLYNIKPEEKLKATELITNGGFIDGSGWEKTSTNITFSGGKAVFAEVDGYHYLRTSTDFFEKDKTYKVSFTITDFTMVGTANPQLLVQESNNQNPTITSIKASGQYSFIYKAKGKENNGAQLGTPSKLVFKNSGADASNKVSFKLDNVSVKEVEQAPKDFTFTRGSNLTATRVGPDGKIEKGRENMIRYSNTLTNSSWGISETVYNDIVGGQQGYDGSNTAFLIDKITNGNSYVSVPVLTYDGVFTWSGYFKNEGSKDNGIYMFTPEVSQYFNLANGQKISNPGGTNPIASSIESIGNGWYRCSVTGFGGIDSGVSNDRPRFKVTNLDGSDPGTGAYNDTGKIFAQDLQFEAGLVATDYIDSPGGTTGKSGILEDSPRFDYTGVTCPHLLMEPTRTNKVKYTEAFAVGTGNSGWQKVGITVTQNNAISPEGVQNASLIVPSTSAEDHYISHGTHFSNVGEYLTISLFAKIPVNGNQYLYMNSGASRLYAIFNLSGSGSIEQVEANGVDFEDGSTASNSGDNTNNIAPSASITALENGWFRCVLTGKSKTTASGYIRIGCAPTDQNNHHTPDAAGDGNGMLIYGSQVEAGAFATSYIPNHGTAFVGNTSPETGGVTRNFDTTDDVDFSDYMDGKDITFFADLAKNPSLDRDSASTGIRFGKRNHNFGAFRIYRPNPNTSAKVYWADNDNDTTPTSHTISETGRVKVIVRRVESTGEFTVFYAGAQKYQASNTDFDDLVNLQIRADGQPIFINSILVFDRALTDDECKSLTTV